MAETVLEKRVASLEKQLRQFFKWQQTLTSMLATSFSSVEDFFAHVESTGNSGAPIAGVKTADSPLNRIATPQRSTLPEVESNTSANSGEEKVGLEKASTKISASFETIATVQEISLTPVVTPKESALPAIAINEKVLPSILSKTTVVPERASTKVAFRILDIIQSYGQNLGDDEVSRTEKRWLGRAKFAPKVEQHVEAGQPIRMILPAFPWKSINLVDKVIGKLPDLGEELAMARLHSMCVDIAAVYQHGAEVTIATDGLVFNDTVGITDEDTWEYSAALMDMVARKGYHGIKLVRVMDLLGMTTGREMTKELYIDSVEACRKELDAQFGKPEEAVREMVQTDEDALLTYRGFIRFLETDLKHCPTAKKSLSGSQYRKFVKQVAMRMMARAESFTKIIQAKCPDYVRLSIHPSSGAVKLSIPLILQTSGAFPKSPWHCSIAVGVDGSYSTVHSKDVRDTHNLIYRNGRPYFYRERSELYDWAEEESVEIEHLYPSGIRVYPKTDAEGLCQLSEENLGKLKRLAGVQSVVVLQGFLNMADGAVRAA